MKKLKEPENVHEALRRTKVLFYGGFVLLLVSVFVMEFAQSLAVALLLDIVGILMLVWGWLYGKERCVCPHCGHSLYVSGFRIPSKMPNYCPHCGEGL